jgi:hypothetical protein
MAVAYGLFNALRPSGRKPVPMPRPVPDPGRLNIVSCRKYLPGDADKCGWATDPRGAGEAYGGVESSGEE